MVLNRRGSWFGLVWFYCVCLLGLAAIVVAYVLLKPLCCRGRWRRQRRETGESGLYLRNREEIEQRQATDIMFANVTRMLEMG